MLKFNRISGLAGREIVKIYFRSNSR